MLTPSVLGPKTPTKISHQTLLAISMSKTLLKAVGSKLQILCAKWPHFFGYKCSLHSQLPKYVILCRLGQKEARYRTRKQTPVPLEDFVPESLALFVARFHPQPKIASKVSNHPCVIASGLTKCSNMFSRCQFMGRSLYSHHAVMLTVFLHPSHSNLFPFFLSLNFKISTLFCCAACQLGCIKYTWKICLSVGNGRYFFGKKKLHRGK